MWRASIVTVAPSGEPVTVDQVKQFCRIDGTAFDAQLGILIAGVRSEIEGITGTPLATQTVTLQASTWTDLALLPIAPVRSIEAIAYRDLAGAAFTIDVDDYALSGGGLEWSIAPSTGTSWPGSRQAGSWIEVTAIVGYEVVPPRVLLALLLGVRAAFDDRDFDLTAMLWNDRITG